MVGMSNRRQRPHRHRDVGLVLQRVHSKIEHRPAIEVGYGTRAVAPAPGLYRSEHGIFEQAAESRLRPSPQIQWGMVYTHKKRSAHETVTTWPK